MNIWRSNPDVARMALLLTLAFAAGSAVPACGGSKLPVGPTSTCDGTFTVSPSSSTGMGLAGATLYTFTSSGNCSSHAWDFGDGSTGQGYIVTHTYGTSGSFAVSHTATSSSETVTATQHVAVRDMTGTWRGTMGTNPPVTFTLVLTQAGWRLAGTYADDQLGSASLGLADVSDGRNPDNGSFWNGAFFNIWVIKGDRQFNLQGQGSGDLNTFTGWSDYDANGYREEMKVTRQ